MCRAALNVQGWLLFAQRAKPAEQVRIAAELGGTANPWESASKISEEAANGTSILPHGAGAQGEGEGLEMNFQDAFELGWMMSHERWEGSSAFLFSIARAYSRQTSCGASWT